MNDLTYRRLNTLLLKDFKEDYADGLIDYGSGLEMTTAIFCNVLRMNAQYNIINEAWCRHRTSQYVRAFSDDDYKVDPPFRLWETMLHI
jgi:hypothetical protein